MEVWDSMAAWAARRLAASMRPATCVEGGADASFIDKCRYLLEDAVLLDHVGGLEDGAGEHGLPVQGGGFGLEFADVERGGVVDEGEASLGRDEFDDLVEVLVGVGEADDVFDVAGCRGRGPLR